jgi:hypothetical protein
MNTRLTEDLPLACDANALTPEQRERWVKDIAPKLYREVQKIQEIPDGWAWRLPSTPEVLFLLAEELNVERLCCPFVTYTLEIEPNRGPFWLRMTGGEGVKAFLKMAFETTNHFDPQVAKAAGLNIPADPDMDSVETVLEAVDRLNERYARTVGSS